MGKVNGYYNIVRKNRDNKKSVDNINFDGFHRGPSVLIKKLVNMLRKNISSVVFTFKIIQLIISKQIHKNI